MLGLAFMLPGHLFGATGAGDVKLFAAAGALIGPTPIVTAFFYTAIAGGLLALVVAATGGSGCSGRSGRPRDSSRRLPRTSTAIASPLEDNRFAYAPAIAVGALIAALGR